VKFIKDLMAERAAVKQGPELWSLKNVLN